MKTNGLRIAVAIIGLVMGSLSVNAQEVFYSTTSKDGKIETRTKYAMGNYGLCEKKSVSEYTYDQEGDFVKKEVFVWNGKYTWNDKGTVWYPDYSKENWLPDYRIEKKKGELAGMVVMELSSWNKQKNTYNKPHEKMIYKFYEQDKIAYLAFQKGNKYTELVNEISQDSNSNNRFLTSNP
jgi:hypothetical protein